MKIAHHEAVVEVPVSKSRLPSSSGFSVSGNLRLDITPQVMRDRALKQVFDRTSDWRRLILAAESQRLRKAQQDQLVGRIIYSAIAEISSGVNTFAPCKSLEIGKPLFIRDPQFG